jgi:hypothetical protein
MQVQPTNELIAEQAQHSADEPIHVRDQQPAIGLPPSRAKMGYFSKTKNWISFLTLLFVGAYTIMTLFIVRSSEEQVRISRLNFKMDERPYILVEDTKGQSLNFKKGERARWDIQYVNYGKSPAVKAATDAHVWVGKRAISTTDGFFSKSSVIKPEGMAEFITPPNSSAAGPSANGFHYVTLFSDAATTDDDIAFMKANDGGVLVAGRVWYSDLFGDVHWTDFCRYTLVSGAISDCPRHNDIH